MSYGTSVTFEATPLNQYTVPFPYIDSGDVYCFVGTGEDAVTQTFVFLTTFTIALDANPAPGTPITLRRVTSVSETRMNVFSDVVRSKTLNLNFARLLYFDQEVSDGGVGTGGGGSGGNLIAGVATFNGRQGAVNLSSVDVTTALGYSPVRSVNGQTGATNLTAAIVGAIPAAEKGALSGVATLDNTGKIPTAQLPAAYVPQTFVVASQSAMLALSSAVRGDFARRTDTEETYVLQATPPATLANWVLFSGGGAVTSINGLSGDVVLTPAILGSIPSIKDYGAVCDGTTDDLAAWNAMVAAANAGTIKAVYVPGLSCVSAPINQLVRGIALHGCGARNSGPVLTGGDGILLDFEVGASFVNSDRVSLFNIGLFTKLNNVGQALRIGFANAGHGYYQSVVMEDVEVMGFLTSNGFNRGIQLRNVYASSFSKVYVTGYQSGAYPASNVISPWAWKTEADTGNYCIDLLWTQCRTTAVAVGWYGTDHLEGLTWHQCITVFQGLGWNIATSGGTYFSWIDCQTDCLNGSISLTNCANVFMKGNLFFRTAASPGADNCVYVTDCNLGLVIQGNHFVTVGAPANIGNMLVLNNCLGAKVQNNLFWVWNGIAVWIMGVSAFAQVYDNEFINPYGNGTPYRNDATPNSNAQSNKFRRNGIQGVNAAFNNPDLSVQNLTTGPVTTTPTSQMSATFPLIVGERIKVQIYGYVTYAGYPAQLNSRFRETAHAPSTGSPKTLLQFAFNKNHSIRTYPLNLDVLEAYVVEEFEFDVVDTALDAVLSHDMWCSLGTQQRNIDQMRIIKL